MKKQRENDTERIRITEKRIKKSKDEENTPAVYNNFCDKSDVYGRHDYFLHSISEVENITISGFECLKLTCYVLFGSETPQKMAVLTYYWFDEKNFSQNSPQQIYHRSSLNLMVVRDYLSLHSFNKFCELVEKVAKQNVDISSVINSKIRKVYVFSKYHMREIIGKIQSYRLKKQYENIIKQLKKKIKDSESLISILQTDLSSSRRKTGRPFACWNDDSMKIESDDSVFTVAKKIKNIHNYHRKLLKKAASSLSKVFESNPDLRVQLMVRVMNSGVFEYSSTSVCSSSNPKENGISMKSFSRENDFLEEMTPEELLSEKERLNLSVKLLKVLVSAGFFNAKFKQFEDFVKSLLMIISRSVFIVIEIEGETESQIGFVKEITCVLSELFSHLESAYEDFEESLDYHLDMLSLNEQAQGLLIHNKNYLVTYFSTEKNTSPLRIIWSTSLLDCGDKFSFKEHERYLELISLAIKKEPLKTHGYVILATILKEFNLTQNISFLKGLKCVFDKAKEGKIKLKLKSSRVLDILNKRKENKFFFKVFNNADVNKLMQNEFCNVDVCFHNVFHIQDMADVWNKIFTARKDRKMFSFSSMITYKFRHLLQFILKPKKNNIQLIDEKKRITFTFILLVLFRKNSAVKYNGNVPYLFKERLPHKGDFLNVSQMLGDHFHEIFMKMRCDWNVVWFDIIDKSCFYAFELKSQEEYSNQLRRVFGMLKKLNITNDFMVDELMPYFCVKEDCELTGGQFKRLLAVFKDKTSPFVEHIFQIISKIEKENQKNFIANELKLFIDHAKRTINGIVQEDKGIHPNFQNFLCHYIDQDFECEYRSIKCGSKGSQPLYLSTMKRTKVKQSLRWAGKTANLKMGANEKVNQIALNHIQFKSRPPIQPNTKIESNSLLTGEKIEISGKIVSMLSNMCIYLKKKLNPNLKYCSSNKNVMDNLSKKIKEENACSSVKNLKVQTLERLSEMESPKLSEITNFQDLKHYEPYSKLEKLDYDYFIQPIMDYRSKMHCHVVQGYNLFPEYVNKTNLKKLECLMFGSSLPYFHGLSSIVKSYQVSQVEKSTERLIKKKKGNLTVLPCGGGKTFYFAVKESYWRHNSEKSGVTLSIYVTESSSLIQSKEDVNHFSRLTKHELGPVCLFVGSSIRKHAAFEKWKQASSVLFLSYSILKRIFKKENEFYKSIFDDLLHILKNEKVSFTFDEATVLGYKTEERKAAFFFSRMGVFTELMTGILEYEEEKIKNLAKFVCPEVVLRTIEDVKSFLSTFPQINVDFPCNLKQQVVVLKLPFLLKDMLNRYYRYYNLSPNDKFQKSCVGIDYSSDIRRIMLHPLLFEDVMQREDIEIPKKLTKYLETNMIELQKFNFGLIKIIFTILKIMKENNKCCLIYLKKNEIISIKNLMKDYEKEIKVSFSISSNNCSFLTGDDSSNKKYKEIRKMKNNKNVFAIFVSIDGNSKGHSVEFAEYVFFLSFFFNLYDIKQATNRIKRINQLNKKIYCYHIIHDLCEEYKCFKRFTVWKMCKEKEMLGEKINADKCLKKLDEKKNQLEIDSDDVFAKCFSGESNISRIVDLMKLFEN